MITVRRRAINVLFCLTAAATIAAGLSLLGQQAPFSERPVKPRVAPVPEQGRSEAQRQMLASTSDFNIFKTLAHHPELYSRWTGLGRFLLNGSSLPARHREMLMLRMGWLCQSEYEWAQHARIATSSAGMTDQEVHRIAEGPGAPGWTDFERTLLRFVDELRYDAIVSDTTWAALRKEYNELQMMEALFTAAQYQLVSMALNSLGVQLDPELRHRLPRNLPLPRLATNEIGARLSGPRLQPIAPDQWTPQQREMIAPQIRSDGSVLKLYTTLIRHPRLYAPRASFGIYLHQETSLPPRTRELLIMRTAFLIGAEYEWGHHVQHARAAGFTDEEIARIATGPGASGWSEEHRAVLRAADELRREAFITDRTWETLARSYNARQLIEIVFTVGGYTMTGLAINSFGIQLEPGYPLFPRSSKPRQVSKGFSQGEWTTWGGDAGFTRYSPLDQINRENVGTVEVAWRWKSLPQGTRPDGNLKATPLMVDGVLYTPTGVHQVAALDPASGRTLWTFTPTPAALPGRPLTLSNRGVAYWSDGVEKRIFHNTLDGRLLSIDAKSGMADPAFGRNGTVMLKEQLVDDRAVELVGSSSPATVVGNVVIAQAVGEANAPNKEATPGHIRGYDVKTGKLLWTFHTIPQTGEPGNETWENESWKFTGNTGVWSMMSADPELGYLYLPVETPTHDFTGGTGLATICLQKVSSASRPGQAKECGTIRSSTMASGTTIRPRLLFCTISTSTGEQSSR